jgi:hypothetical protein
MWQGENVMNVKISATTLSSFHFPHLHIYTFITFLL